jgi:nitroreductase/dihydropteridine reductase
MHKFDVVGIKQKPFLNTVYFMDTTTILYIVIGILAVGVIVLGLRLYKQSNAVEIIQMPVNEKPVCSTFLSNLDWRRAVKKFAPGAVDYEPILQAIRSAPSSFGVQPYHVVILTNKQLRMDIKPHCFGQEQITSCDVLLVFCAIKHVDVRADEFIKESGSEALRPMLTGFLANKSEADKIDWARKQAYIALGYAMAAASELKIASCPMEGFMPDKVAEILATPPNHIPTVFLALGREDTSEVLRPRFKFPMETLFHLED